MEACVDLVGLSAKPLAIHRWWFLNLGRGGVLRVVPLPDNSVTHHCVLADPSHFVRPCFEFQWSITFTLSSSLAGTSGQPVAGRKSQVGRPSQFVCVCLCVCVCVCVCTYFRWSLASGPLREIRADS